MNKETKIIYTIFFAMLLIGAALLVWRWPVVKSTVLPSAQATDVSVSQNYVLNIPKLGITTTLDQTDLDVTKRLQVPANPQVAAWYKSGPTPGSAGTTLITGHLSSAAGPGIFYNLHKLTAGDTIHIDDGQHKFVYKIDQVQSYNQDNSFPWAKVYSTTGASELRIITCDGVYSQTSRHFSKNLVVYASLVK